MGMVSFCQNPECPLHSCLVTDAGLDCEQLLEIEFTEPSTETDGPSYSVHQIRRTLMGSGQKLVWVCEECAQDPKWVRMAALGG